MNRLPAGYGNGPPAPWQPPPPPRKRMNLALVIVLVILGLLGSFVVFVYLMARIDDAAHGSYRPEPPATSAGSHGGL